MPNFLTWGMNRENTQFGAYIQLNGSVFKPQPDGTVIVEKAPRTEFFTHDKMIAMAAKAGAKTQAFWRDISAMCPAQEASFMESRDVGSDSGEIRIGDSSYGLALGLAN